MPATGSDRLAALARAQQLISARLIGKSAKLVYKSKEESNRSMVVTNGSLNSTRSTHSHQDENDYEQIVAFV